MFRYWRSKITKRLRMAHGHLQAMFSSGTCFRDHSRSAKLAKVPKARDNKSCPLDVQEPFLMTCSVGPQRAPLSHTCLVGCDLEWLSVLSRAKMTTSRSEVLPK